MFWKKISRGVSASVVIKKCENFFSLSLNSLIVALLIFTHYLI